MEILETQVHGGRVRGRIVWEEEDLECVDGKNRLRRKKKKTKKKKKKSLLEKRPKRKSKIFQRGRAKKKKTDDDNGTHHEDEDDDSVDENNMVKYSGWISVQWADDEEEDGNVAARLGSGSDEDAGPWTGKCVLFSFVSIIGSIPISLLTLSHRFLSSLPDRTYSIGSIPNFLWSRSPTT